MRDHGGRREHRADADGPIGSEDSNSTASAEDDANGCGCDQRGTSTGSAFVLLGLVMIARRRREA
jgi:MYXO-CTERM domain-containing protein